MYNVLVVVVLIVIIFFTSGDKHFSRVFGSMSTQILFGLIVAYFSLTNGSFSMLLLGCILLALRYSNIAALVKPYSNRSPIVADFYKLLLSIRSSTVDEEEIEYFNGGEDRDWDPDQYSDLDQEIDDNWETQTAGTVGTSGTIDIKIDDDDLIGLFEENQNEDVNEGVNEGVNDDFWNN